MIVIPGTPALNDIKATVDFIKLISTADGLSQALAQLAEKSEDLNKREAAISLSVKDAEEKIAAAAAIKEELKQISIKANSDKAEAVASIRKSQDDAVALAFTKDAVELSATELVKRIEAFEKEKAEATLFLQEKQAELNKRLEEADNLKDHYEKKSAELKTIVGG